MLPDGLNSSLGRLCGSFPEGGSHPHCQSLIQAEAGTCLLKRGKEKLRRFNWERVPDSKVEGTIFEDITPTPAKKCRRLLSVQEKEEEGVVEEEDRLKVDIEALSHLFSLAHTKAKQTKAQQKAASKSLGSHSLSSCLASWDSSPPIENSTLL